MLEFRNVTKRFGSQVVLRGVDLTVHSGRVTALIGPNGAGKTTLIKSVLGLTHHDGGDILIGGASATGDAYRARIGYMPQIARFPDNLSGADLVAMMADLRGVRVGTDATDTQLVDRFMLEPELRKPLRVLSGGTRQKVNAVLAFLFRPEILILDEPTAGIEPVSSAAIKDRIAEERDRGRSILLTSHVSRELEELADDVAFLLEGRIHFAGPIDDLLRRTGQRRLERAVAHVLARVSSEGATALGSDRPAALGAREAA